MSDDRKINVRTVSAVAGSGAVLALCWLGAGIGGQGTTLALHSPPPPPTVNSGPMTLGATTTTGVAAPVTAAPMKAQPKITGPAALPSEEAGLP